MRGASCLRCLPVRQRLLRRNPACIAAIGEMAAVRGAYGSGHEVAARDSTGCRKPELDAARSDQGIVQYFRITRLVEVDAVIAAIADDIVTHDSGGHLGAALYRRVPMGWA